MKNPFVYGEGEGKGKDCHTAVLTQGTNFLAAGDPK